MLSQQIDSTIRKHFITSSFVTHLVSLFDSIDSREREYLKTITHRIYGKLTNRRASIRKAINHTFYEFLHKMRQYEEYNMQLSYCMTLYISKDVTLSRPVSLNLSLHDIDHHCIITVLAYW